jgi:hypothetical protein
MKKIYLALIVASCINGVMAQTGSIGIGTANPNASAALDISSNNKGLLLPRVSSVQRTAINAPATGLIVFDTDKRLLYFYNGLQWVPLVPGDPTQASQQIHSADDLETGDYLGRSVGLEGDYAIAGAPLDDEPAVDQGSAYIYFRNGGQWVQQAKITASDGAAGDAFGTSVDISGEYAIVGAPQNADGGQQVRGAAYIFHRNGTTWTQVAKISSSTIGANQRFGQSVSIDGDLAAIGASNYSDLGNTLISNCGRVEIRRRVGAAWNLERNIIPVLQEFAHAGLSVSLKGNHVIIGAPDEDFNSNTNSGAAYIYFFNGTNWVLEGRLNSGTQAALDYFGYSVDIDNGFAVIGSPGQYNTGSIHIYKRVFIILGWAWQEQSVNPNNFTFPPNKDFGHSVAISGDYVITGVPDYDVGLNNGQGICFIFKRSSTDQWRILKTISHNPAYASDQLGNAVAIDNLQTIAGIPGTPAFSFSKPRVQFNVVE